MQKQEEEGICMHATLTESSLNKELIVLGEMEEALTFCHDIKYRYIVYQAVKGCQSHIARGMVCGIHYQFPLCLNQENTTSCEGDTTARNHCFLT